MVVLAARSAFLGSSHWPFDCLIGELSRVAVVELRALKWHGEKPSARAPGPERPLFRVR